MFVHAGSLSAAIANPNPLQALEFCVSCHGHELVVQDLAWDARGRIKVSFESLRVGAGPSLEQGEEGEPA